MNALSFLRIYITSQTNATLYLVSKIPLIGRLISDKVYGRYVFKKWVALIGVLKDTVVKIISSNLSILLFVYLAPRLFLSGEIISEADYYFLFLMLFCIGGFMSGSTIFRSNQEDLMFIHHFMVNPRSYYLYKAIKTVIQKGILTFPVLLYIFRNGVVAGTLTLTYSAFILTTNVAYLSLFKKTGKVIPLRIRSICSLLWYAGSYFLCFLRIIPSFEIHNSFVWYVWSLGALCLLLVMLFYHFAYSAYGEMALKFAEKGVISISITTGNLTEGNNGLISQSANELQMYYENNKKKDIGRYLDDAFSYRFRKAIREPIINTFYVYTILFLIVGLSIRMKWIGVDTENLLLYSPIMVSLALGCSYAEEYIQRYFRNIDFFLLKERRTNKALVQGTMLRRYAQTLVRDVVILLILAFDIAVFLLVSGLQVKVKDVAVMFAICPPVLLIQDSYEWLVYYLFQPYSEDLLVRSPMITALGYIEPLLGLVFLFIRTNIVASLPIILCIMFGSMVCVYLGSSFAYKTFKLHY